MLVGGNAQLDQGIPKTIEQLNLQKAVIQKGYVSQSDLPKYYRGAVGFISPALYEGFGLPLLEAMACGCPVIAGNNSSQSEIIGNAGILVDAENTQQISDALSILAENETLRRRYSKKAIRQSRLFSWHRFARTLLDRMHDCYT